MVSKVTEQSVITAPGMKMPIVGLGSWQATEEEVESAVNAALEAGYRHIDTAFVYLNEKAIGKALKKWLDSGKVKREELFIVTKLPSCAMNEKYVEDFLTQSLTALQLSYVDLYLVHHPVGLVAGEKDLFPRDDKGNLKVDPTTDHIAIWKAMEKQVDAGRTKSIGVSNFNSRQIDKILANCRIAPANNQVELHLYLQQKELQAWSRKTGVSLCAYAPIGSPSLIKFNEESGSTPNDSMTQPSPLSDPVVQRIAAAHNKTPAQVLLRHLMQLGVAVIPKSSNPDRIRSNFQVFDFELNDAEMAELNALDKGEKGRRFVGGVFKGLEEHPDMKQPSPLSDPVVQRIAAAHNKLAAQVLLRHLMQLGVAVIPKSSNPDRIRSNFQVFDFELNDAEMAELNALDKGEKGRRFIGGFLSGREKHPEYPF